MGRKIPKQLIIDAILRNRGLVEAAATDLGCTHECLRVRAKQDPDIAQAIADARERLVDFAETKMFDALERGDSWAIAMVLKTLGKGRGYVERQEVVQAGEPLQVVTRIVRVSGDSDN